MKNTKMEKWIAETANLKNGTSTIFFKGSFLDIWAKMRNGEMVREFRLFTS